MRRSAAGFEPLALLGAALLLGALFIPWYSGVDVPTEFPVHVETYVAHTAWQAFSVVDLALAALAVASTRSRGAAVAAAALIVYRMIDAPAFATLGPGPWLALAGALIAALDGVLRPWMGSALLVVSLFVPWYHDAVYIITRGANDTETISVLSGPGQDLTAWRVFSVLDLVLVALAIAATRFWAAAALAVALVGFRLIDTPTPIPDLATGPGAWLALAGALVALVARVRPRHEASP